MISKLLVEFYRLVHGKLHLRGAGWLIRRLAPLVPGLRAYPLRVADVGVALLDLRDVAAFAMLNISLGEFSNDLYLFRYLEKILKPGDVFWDVGANVGAISGYFAHPRHKLSALHAFEPNPGPLKTLQSLFAGHPFATVHAFGLGDTDETITMSLSSAGSALGTMARDLHEGKQIQVRIRRGDAVRRELQLPPPDVIKVDVEGFEPGVFGGLAETIAGHRPIIVFEHIWLSDEQVKQLTPHDYRIHFVHDDGTVSTDFKTRRKGHDAFFIPAGKAQLPFL